MCLCALLLAATSHEIRLTWVRIIFLERQTNRDGVREKGKVERGKLKEFLFDACRWGERKIYTPENLLAEREREKGNYDEDDDVDGLLCAVDLFSSRRWLTGLSVFSGWFERDERVVESGRIEEVGRQRNRWWSISPDRTIKKIRDLLHIIKLLRENRREIDETLVLKIADRKYWRLIFHNDDLPLFILNDAIVVISLTVCIAKSGGSMIGAHLTRCLTGNRSRHHVT